MSGHSSVFKIEQNLVFDKVYTLQGCMRRGGGGGGGGIARMQGRGRLNSLFTKATTFELFSLPI